MGRALGPKLVLWKRVVLSLLRKFALRVARKWLPLPVRRKIVQLSQWPPIGQVRYGDLRRLRPISDDWGSRRGLPIDRYYIESFLDKYRDDIQGRVLEVKDRKYTVLFGDDRVTVSDVLHKMPGNNRATIVADLEANRPALSPETFDAIILTQTLQFIYDIRTAIKTLYRSLTPGGVLLVTVPGISQISRYDMERWGEYWRFTPLSAEMLFLEVCPDAQVNVDAKGNVLAATAHLYGIASNELDSQELDNVDPDYPLVISVRVVKPN